MRYPTVIMPFVLAAVPAAASAADCQPAFVNPDQSLVIDGVTIEAGGRATEDFQLRVQNAAAGGSGPSGGGPMGSATCEASIRFARFSAPDPDFPAYSLRAPGNREVEVLPDPASGGTADSDVVIANAPAGPQGRSVPFRLTIPTEWGVRAGSYIEQLQAQLLDRDGNVVDTAAVTITVTVPSAVSLRLVGAVVGGSAGGPAQIDLGNLSSTRETRSEPFGALILSTAPYSVRFSSANLGALVHQDGRERVPYRLFFDGAPVDLAGSSEFPYLAHTPRGGDRRPMSIVVPPVVALAGHYSDRITVTVSTL